MLIDKAAAAFHDAHRRFTVERIADTAFFVVREDDGTLHGEGSDLKHPDADQLAAQLGDRDGVTAMLREMISPAVLINAAYVAGIELRKVENNKINMGTRPALALLKGIIEILSREAQ